MANVNLNPEDFPSNSKYNKSEKHIDHPVVTGPVKTKKAPIGERIYDTFISDDASTVKEFILYDVIIPSIRDAIGDILHGSVDRIFGGNSAYRRRSGGTSAYRRLNNTIDFQRVSHDRAFGRVSDGYRPRPSKPDYRSIVLDSRGDAEEVISTLIDAINDYGKATVADLYDAVGISGDFTDNKWGWTNLSKAMVSRVQDGYLIKLPRAQQLD